MFPPLCVAVVKNERSQVISLSFIARSTMFNLNFDTCLKHFCKTLAEI